MVANDFGTLFDAYPTIERVYFNGAAAEKNFGLVSRESAASGAPAPIDESGPNYALRGEAGGLAGSRDHGHRRATVGPWPRRSICAPSDSNVASSDGLPHQLD